MLRLLGGIAVTRSAVHRVPGSWNPLDGSNSNKNSVLGYKSPFESQFLEHSLGYSIKTKEARPLRNPFWLRANSNHLWGAQSHTCTYTHKDEYHLDSFKSNWTIFLVVWSIFSLWPFHLSAVRSGSHWGSDILGLHVREGGEHQVFVAAQFYYLFLRRVWHLGIFKFR